jgi:hypothetical protein
MRNRAFTFLLSAVLAAPTLGYVVGCDRELAHDETTKTKADGTTTHNETTVKEKPDGTVVKTQEKSAYKPATPNP